MERTRCTFCRNPIRPHQSATGPGAEYHEDCWTTAQTVPSRSQPQDEYDRRIAAEGLSGVLAPYLSVFPPEQHSFTAPLEPITQRARAQAAAPLRSQPAAEPAASASVAPVPVVPPPTEAPARRPEPNFVIVGRG